MNKIRLLSNFGFYAIIIIVFVIVCFYVFKKNSGNVYEIIKKDDAIALEQLILDKGYSVDSELLVEIPRCRTHLLHYSIAEGSTKCANLLINYGAILSSRDAQGNTPLMVLIISNQLQIKARNQLFDSLLPISNLNLANIDQETALHLACLYGYTKEIKALLDAGANKNVKNFMGQTPLDIAKERQIDNDGNEILILFSNQN